MGKKEDDIKKIEVALDNGEKKEVFIQTWHDHVKNKNTIKSMSTIIKDQLYYMKPGPNQIFVPFSEFHGDYDICWVLCIDVLTNKELFRKNIKTVDLIDWKLSSSLIKSKTNGK